MTDKPTPEQVKALLDDLARLSIKHGMYFYRVRNGMRITPVNEQFAGYKEDGRRICNAGDSAYLHQAEALSESGITLAGVSSIDITQLSNHERLEIMGGRSRDLARMLRDAFDTGVKAATAGQDNLGHGIFAGDQYAAKIMGEQSPSCTVSCGCVLCDVSADHTAEECRLGKGGQE